MQMTISKPHFPTTTAHTVRLRMFQATRRPKLHEEVIVTSWGKVRVKGRLGQQHADVFEAICYEREKRAELEDGRIKLLVDPAKVRRRSRQTSGTGLDANGKGTTLQRIIDDLQQVIIEIIEPAHLACQGHLIDHIDRAVRSNGTPLTRRNPLGGERALWRVEIGKAFCKLVATDIWVGYDPGPLARLRHGGSQAVARHVLTHKTQPAGGWTLDRLIRTVVGEEIGEQTLRDARRFIRADASALREIGIEIDGNRVHVDQRRDGVEQRRDGVE
jgi:hypothetical protein